MRWPLLFFGNAFCSMLFGQATFSGTVFERIDEHPLSEVVLEVSYSNGECWSYQTDTNGYFAFQVPDSIDSIEIKLLKTGYSHRSKITFDKLRSAEGAFQAIRDYRLGLSMMGVKDCIGFGNPFTFIAGTARQNGIVDFESLRQMLACNPDVCVEFCLYQLPNESTRLGKKRLKVYRKLLLDNGIAETSFKISPEIRVVRQSDAVEGEELKPVILGAFLPAE